MDVMWLCRASETTSALNAHKLCKRLCSLCCLPIAFARLAKGATFGGTSRLVTVKVARPEGLKDQAQETENVLYFIGFYRGDIGSIWG